MSETWAETEALAADLVAAPARLMAGLPAVVSKGALNIKNDWRASASGLKHAPQYPNSINYDISASPDGTSAEIGPDKDKPQGPLGNLLEFGSANNAPHLDGQRALDAEAPRFEAAVEDLAEEAMLG